MGLNIKNPEVEALAAEVAKLAGESKTQAIRQALLDRKARLEAPMTPRGDAMRAYLAAKVWPKIPPRTLGRVLSKAEKEQILGYGPDGV